MCYDLLRFSLCFKICSFGDQWSTSGNSPPPSPSSSAPASPLIRVERRGRCWFPLCFAPPSYKTWLGGAICTKWRTLPGLLPNTTINRVQVVCSTCVAGCRASQQRTQWCPSLSWQRDGGAGGASLVGLGSTQHKPMRQVGSAGGDSNTCLGSRRASQQRT